MTGWTKRTFDSRSLRELPGLIRRGSAVLGGARTGPIRDLVQEYRQGAPASALPDVTARIALTPPLRDTVLHPPSVRAMRRLRSTTPLQPVTLEREIAWAASYLAHFARDLRHFVGLRKRFEAETLCGTPSDALAVLMEVERAHGLTLWGLQRSLAALQELGGLQLQKDMLQKARKAAPKNYLVNYILYFTSMRNEPSVTSSGYAEAVEAAIAGLGENLPSPTRTFIRWHLLTPQPAPADTLAELLSMEAGAPTVDYYEGLILVCRIALASGDPEIAAVVRVSLAHLWNALSIEPEFRISSNDAVSQSGIGDTWTALLEGQPPDIRSLDKLLAEPKFSSAWLCALCATEAPTADQGAETADDASPPSAGRNASITRMLRDVLSGRDPDSRATGDLLKLAMNYGSSSWAEALAATLVLETTETEEEAWLMALRSLHEDCDLPNQVGARVERRGPLGRLFTAWALLREHRTEEALSLCPERTEKMSPYATMLACRLRARCLVGSGSTWEALQEVVWCALRFPAAIDRLPFERVAQAIGRREAAELARKGLELSVFYDMLGRHFGERTDTQRRHAAEDALQARGLRFPSELRDHVVHFDTELLVHFLRHVCVEHVVNKFRHARGARAAAEERLAICRLVAELKPSDQTQAEITALLRRLIIQKGLYNVAKSKVFVDIDSIRETSRARLKEQFARHQAMLQANVGESEMDALLQGMREGKVAELLALRLPKSERNDVFVKMVTFVRDEFASGPAHGLDGYISVRIRHGTLANHLRGPLMEAGLIGLRDETTGTYKDDPAWSDLLEGVSAGAASAIRAHMRRFSEKFDATINVMKNDWLQVCTRSDGKGMFDFSMPESTVRLLSAGVRQDTKLDELLETVLFWLTTRLDQRLQAVRDRIDGEARALLLSHFDELLVAIDHEGARGLGVLQHAIRIAKAEENGAIDRLVEWFHRAPEIASEPFRIDDLIRVSAESVRTGLPVEVVVAEDCQHLWIKGAFFQPLVDMLAIIIENAIKHAGEVVPFRVDVAVSRHPDALHFVVRNPVESIAMERSESKLAVVRDALREGQQLAFIGREGGSGFYKLHKIMAHDLGVTPDFSFGFEASGNAFVVEFSVPGTFSQVIT